MHAIHEVKSERDLSLATAPAERVRVCLLQESAADEALWDSYVVTHAHGSPFHLVAWKRMIQGALGHKPIYLTAFRNDTGKISGVLPLFLVKSRIFGAMLVSTPLAAYGGTLTDSADVQLALFEEARKIALDRQVQFLEIRSFRDPVAHESLQTKDLYVTFCQELWEDPEKNLLAIPRKTRAEVRLGMRNDLEFKVNEIEIKQFYGVYARSVRELGTPVFPMRLFEIGFREFGDKCKIFSVHSKGNLVSSVWTLFHGKEVIPYFGGSIRDYNHLGVNNFMYWMLIRYGCENGYRVYDFGRSKKGTGSFAFKKHWGMNMIELPYQYLLVRAKSMPDTSPLNPKYSRKIEAWKRLPLWAANFLGPIVSRHLT